jgi:hypothetical protein
MIGKPASDSNTEYKRKYNKKKKVDETDFSVITILELLECLSVIILTPANFWKSLIDILKKPKKRIQSKKNSEQIISKLETSGNTEIRTITKRIKPIE